jgi:endonuclease/exonuclease/phosphatase family metal-dependent hydrolase
MKRVRIATYNVHSCIGTDGRCAPERIAEVIAEIDPDIACLQEIDVERQRTGAIDQAVELARILAMQFHFNPTIQEASGRYGDAILSKTPFTLVRASSFSPVPRPYPRERRGAIWIETIAAGRTWQIINTHFGLGRSERRVQAVELVDEWILPALARSTVVVCGDFNSRPASRVHQTIGRSLRDVFRGSGQRNGHTFSTRWPFVCLDYIYASPELGVHRAEAWKSPLAGRASDHFPVVAEIL